MLFSPIRHTTTTYHIRILSDFFYVWLKSARWLISIQNSFQHPLTPKRNEIVAYSHGTGGFEKVCLQSDSLRSRSRCLFKKSTVS